jgi:hypothetical protein
VSPADDATTRKEVARAAAGAEQGWQRLRAAMPRIQVDYTYSGRDIDDPAKRREATFRWRTKGDAFMLLEEQVAVDTLSTQPAVDRVGVNNNRYIFGLTRKPGTSEWVLEEASTDLSKLVNTARPERSQDTISLRDNARQWGHIRLPDGQRICDLLRHPAFTPQSVATVEGGLVRIAFTRTAVDPRSQRSPTVSGWIELDPANDWCCRRSDLRIEHKGWTDFVTQALEVQRVDGVVLLRQGHGEARSQSGEAVKHRHVWDWAYTYTFDDAVPDREFTLTAFGLPEPGGADGGGRWASAAWLGGGAVACGLLGWWLRRRAARRPV